MIRRLLAAISRLRYSDHGWDSIAPLPRSLRSEQVSKRGRAAP